MTTGSLDSSSTFPHTVLYNGSPLKAGLHGFKASRVWSGQDSPSFAQPRWEWRFYDTTKLVRGNIVPVRRKYRHYFEPKRRETYTENPYATTVMSESMPLVELRSTQFFTDGSSNVHGIWSNVAVSDLFPGSSIPAAAFDDESELQLVQKLQEQVRGSDFNTAVFLAEGREACNMIADSAVKLARAYRFARKGAFVDAARTLYNPRKRPPRALRKKVSGSWLELQYGWLPLLQDMKTGAEQLAHHLEFPFRKKVFARHSNYLYGDRTGKAKSVTVPINSWQVEFADCYSVAQRQIVATLSEPESLPKLSGLMDPELIAWEMVPFSFVVDWFAPVGDYLSARAFAGSLHGTFVITDTVRVHASGFKRARFDGSGTPGLAYTEISPQAGQIAPYYYNKLVMSRTVGNSVPIPSFPKVKSLDSALGFRRCLNAIALLAAVLPGKIK